MASMDLFRYNQIIEVNLESNVYQINNCEIVLTRES